MTRSQKIWNWITLMLVFKNVNNSYSDSRKGQMVTLYLSADAGVKLNMPAVQYTLITTPMTWSEAQAHCVRLYGNSGGTLAKLDEAEIVTQIFKVQGSPSKFWVGLYCADDNCKEVLWSDGDPFIQSVDMTVDTGSGSKGKMYFFASTGSATELKRDVDSAANAFVCEHQSNASHCGVSCSGVPSCNTTGYSVSGISQDDCRAICRTKHGCWMYWYEDRQCLLGVLNCWKASLYSGPGTATVDGTDTQSRPPDGSSLSPPVGTVPELATTTASTVAAETGSFAELHAATLTAAGTLAGAAARTVTVFAAQTVTVAPSHVTQLAPSTSCQPGCTDTVTLHSTYTFQCPDVVHGTGQSSGLMTSFLSDDAVTETSRHPIPTSETLGPGDVMRASSSFRSRSLTTVRAERYSSQYTTSPLSDLVVSFSAASHAPSSLLPFGRQGKELRAAIVEKLTVPRDDLSKRRRTKISVYDTRPVATMSGATACIFLGCSFAAIVALDIPVLVKHLKRILRRCKR